ERMAVVPRAAAVGEARVAVEDDERHVIAFCKRVAHTARPAVRVPLLETELHRIEVGVERRYCLFLIELGKRRRATGSRHEYAGGVERRDAKQGDPSVHQRSLLDVDDRGV